MFDWLGIIDGEDFDDVDELYDAIGDILQQIGGQEDNIKSLCHDIINLNFK